MNVSNTAAFNAALAAALPGDTVLLPSGVFHFIGGIHRSNLIDVEIHFQGTAVAVAEISDLWPSTQQSSQWDDFFCIESSSNVTLRSTAADPQQTTIDGQGKLWWNKMMTNDLPGDRHRPMLVAFRNVTDGLMSGLNVLNGPCFHFYLHQVLRVEVAHCNVEVDRWEQRRIKQVLREEHTAGSGMSIDLANPWTPLQPWDLNTDGIDTYGKDIWIHDCIINNDDDSIAVKPTDASGTYSACTENVLIEDTIMTGFGASIGSVSPHENHNCVKNITFRNISMPQTGKGIYIKSNPSCDADGTKTGEITDILYEVYI
jgi:polygalacturonase